MSNYRRLFHLPLTALLAMTCGFPLGCGDVFRSWDYPDCRVPPDRLRQIDTLDFEAMSAPDGADKPPDAGGRDPASRPAEADAPAELKLTLEQCRALSLEGNLDLQVELLNPTIAATGITEAESRFETLFVIDGSYSKTDPPTAGGLGGSQAESLAVAPGVQIPMRTGGTIALDLPVSKSRTEDGTSTLDPYYTADFAVSISQPLLRGGGIRANTSAIRIARLEQQRSEALTKLEVIQVLAAVDRSYWLLYAARGELEVRKQRHDLAAAQLERARRQVAAGAKPETEIVRAESGVADSLEGIITAENDVRDRQRDLKRLLQKPGLGIETPTVILPISPPSVERHRLDDRRIVELAMANRMELLELELQIAEDSSSIDFERNQALPLVTLGYTYNVSGLGDSCSEAFDMLFHKRFEDHSLGLQVEIPIDNQAARSRLRRAILTRIQRLATRQRRRTLIEQQVYNSIDQLEANWQRILASRQQVVYARRVMAAEQRQFDQGLRTSTEVLQAQTSLADAQSAAILALTEYQIAQVDIAVATGMLLGADRVRWEPIIPREISKE